MNKPKITPKDFFLWFGAMATLYASVSAFIALVFNCLNYTMPDALSYYSGDPYSGGVSYQMASLFVLVPIFIVLMRLIHRGIERDQSRADIWVRRWALFLTLFVAGATIAGVLITLIMFFFNGDVTFRFVLKVLVILLVAGVGFLHFLADLRDYWQRNPSKSRLVGYAIGVLIIITIVGGFFIVGTPWQARLYRYDEQKVGDLSNIQYQVVYYWQAKQKMPATLADLSDPISGFIAPTDPQTREPYEYAVKGMRAFELCGTFNAKARPYSSATRTVPVAPGYPEKSIENDVWRQEGGCPGIERTLHQDGSPPLKSAL